MSTEKKYTVTTPDYETTVAVWFELTSDKDFSEKIPSRPVQVASSRKNNPRNTEYWLTEEEAKILREDHRVQAVEEVDLVPIVKNAFQEGTFSKAPVNSAGQNQFNWGLIRHIQQTNTFGSGPESVTTSSYDYVLDGTGVDVVILDSGIIPDHPDFQDANGVSRVKEIDWYTESGVSGTLPTDFYTDFDGHGTQCASIVAGKRMGWAKNADIYAIKLAGLEGDSDPNPGISPADAFDCLLGWHNAKTNGRPTVINNSWEYVVFWDTVNEQLSFDPSFSGTTYNISGGSYRGVAWSGGTYDTAKGHVGTDIGSDRRQLPYRVASADADIQTLSGSGIIVVNSSGNDYQKVDIPSGTDYNNYVTGNGLGDYYYHRGASPFSEYGEGFEVPSLSSNIIIGEYVNSFSNRGPATPVIAAGGLITAASVNGYEFFGETGYNYASVSGTSFSAPQIAGMSALLLQAHPDWTPLQIFNWFIDNSVENALRDSGQDNDYTETFSLLGGDNLLSYFPLVGRVPFQHVG